MRDIDVRISLRDLIMAQHQYEPDTLVLDELGLYGGAVRVDLTAINGCMHGYEIKSNRDTLERLPAQVELYSEVLDLATLVVGEKHHAKAKVLVPEWWGISIALPCESGSIVLAEERKAQTNPNIDAFAVACLLWRDEALQLLEEADAAKGVRSKPREFLYRRLAESLTLDQLRDLVRERLKARYLQGVWRNSERRLKEHCHVQVPVRVAVSPLQYDDWFQSLARSLVFPVHSVS